MLVEAVRHPLGYFLVMVVVLSAASLPPSPPTLLAAKLHPPLLLAGLASLAAAVAAALDWWMVRRVFRLATLDRVRRHRLFARAERWAKVAPFLTVVTFAALPLPFMIPRVLVPLSGYPLPRYVAATAIGRFPRIFVIAAFGQVFDIPAWALEELFAGGVALAAIGAVLRRLGWVGGPLPLDPSEGQEPPRNAADVTRHKRDQVRHSKDG